MAPISIPCAHCDANVPFGESACPNCKAPVDAELTARLVDKAESSNPEYRAARTRASQATLLLLIAGLIHLLGAAILVYADQPSLPGELKEATLSSAVAAGCFFGASAWSRIAPKWAFIATLVVWSIQEVSSILSNPSAWLPLGFGAVAVLFLEFVFVVLLVRGVFAAVTTDRLAMEMRQRGRA